MKKKSTSSVLRKKSQSSSSPNSETKELKKKSIQPTSTTKFSAKPSPTVEISNERTAKERKPSVPPSKSIRNQSSIGQKSAKLLDLDSEEPENDFSVPSYASKTSDLLLDIDNVSGNNESDFFSGVTMNDSEFSVIPSLPMKYATRYTIIREIGSGGFGKVFEAKDNKSNKSVALKKVVCPTIENLNSAMEEFKHVLNMKHDNIASYLDSYVDTSTNALNQFVLCIIMPLYSGDLAQLLHSSKVRSKHLSESDIRHIALDIAIGLKYMHGYQLIHRDLKPANIFVSPHGVLNVPITEVPYNRMKYCIGDFGLVKNIEDSFAETTAGTQIYMSPELFDNKPYHQTADIWSLGCILLELCKLSLDKKLQYMQLLLKGEDKYHQEIRSQLKELGYSDELVSIIQNCLKKEASDRHSADQIIQNLSV
jgi:hypothetical protein